MLLSVFVAFLRSSGALTVGKAVVPSQSEAFGEEGASPAGRLGMQF